MKFSQQLTYDAPPADVLAMLADPAFREKVCVAMSAVRHEVDIDGSGAGMTVVVDQTQPGDGIPSFAKKFVGDEIQIVQRESWKNASSATLLVQIPGKPGDFKGGIDLAGDDDGTVETVAGDIKVKIPMIGGKLEGLIGDLLGKALKSEQRVGRAWLAGDR
jgi:hypothetical protein